ncbi:MAG: LptF/LptG family permease [Sphingobacteriaceae bacterium]|nr:LptF/LptG family permease [Sphingobacteriaceae bacterium]
MKKIHIFIIKSFIRPFIVTFCIVMFILLMFVLFKYIDDLLGKGLEWYVIFEVMFYASATNVAMALPLSVLLASIMTFGNLGENYELVAIKSAGISLKNAMAPLFVLVIGLSLASFAFSDYILPKANLKYGSLLYDIRGKKLSFMLKEGVFNNSIPNYSIRIDKKSPDGNSLYGVMIYDHTSNLSVPKIIIAKEGKLYKTNGDSAVVFKLKDGIRYEEASGNGSYDPRQQFYRMRFKETEQKFDFSIFKMKRTEENSFKNETQMLNLKGLVHKQDSLKKNLDSTNTYIKNSLSSYYKQSYYVKGYSKIKTKAFPLKKGSILDVIPKTDRLRAAQSGFDQAESIRVSLNNLLENHAQQRIEITRTEVEYQRKFILAASCLLLFCIGAPLGAIIRKGGLGLPVVMAVVFFLIFHVISVVSEKSAKEGSLTVFFGMWMAIILLTPVAAFLTYKATVDSALFDLSTYTRKFAAVGNLFRRKK